MRPTRLAPLLAAALLLAPHPAAGAPPDDPAELAAFLDGFMASAMRRLHVPGAVFALVKEDGVFLLRGFGEADLETGRPVDPERTLFRVASVSKLVTTTALLQQVERGRIDLRADVNTMLEAVRIPADWPDPVTPAHLLTHTAGFDDLYFGMAVRTREELRPLRDYLREEMPRRALPPGDVISYSNHGMALAGRLVEVASQTPFEEYVRAEILGPLGMHRSDFVLRPDMEPHLAQGYVWDDGAYEAVPYDTMQIRPAGSLVTTGADIARFMRAHLREGELDGARILPPAMAERMHRTQFVQHPKLGGFAYGFLVAHENGRRLLEHGGGWRGFGSQLVLDPEGGFGFFVSHNALSADGREALLARDLVRALYDRWFPWPDPEPAAPPADFAERAERFTGAYRYNRHARDSFAKLAMAVSEVEVSATGEGRLRVEFPGALLPPFELTEVEPRVFERSDARGFAVFRTDSQGRATHLFLDDPAPTVLDRLPWHESASSHALVLGAAALLYLSVLLGWPLAFLLRRDRPRPARAARAARLVAGAQAALFLGSFAFLARELGGDPYEYIHAVPARTLWLLQGSWLQAALVGAMAVFASLAWARGWWSAPARLHYTATALVSLALLPILAYWRLFPLP